MLSELRARLRAWLIALVREAIRIERAANQPVVAGKIPLIFHEGELSTRYDINKVASKPVTVSEPSFEQMQTAAIQEQEKHYAPQQQ